MARSWVSEVLEEIGRPELVTSAQLAVSELVTNAILHSDPPVTVRVAGTLEHPRIEVTDNSVVPPSPPGKSLDGSALNTTGRGLTLVALHSESWGADVDKIATGKTVWFEPSSDLHEDGDLAGDLYDLDLDGLAEDPVDREDLIPIVLQGVPVQIMLELRTHYNEIRRELRLLALSDPSGYPEAEHLTSIFNRLDQERVRDSGGDALERSVASGRRTIDLDYLVPTRTPQTMRDLLAALSEIYTLLEGETMLAVSPPEQVLALQRWCIEEFTRQGDGETPRPWTGALEIAPDADAS